MSLVLSASNESPPSRAVMMLIEILNLDVKFHEISLAAREHFKADFVAKNPLHSIPMLEDEHFIIVDSHPIMTYLVSKHGDDGLYPKDLKARCLVDQRLYFDATVLFPRLRNVIYSIYGKSKGVTPDQRKDIEEAYGFLEMYLQKSTYIAGDHLTVADLSCVATISSLQYINPVDDRFIRIHQWWDKLKAERWYLTKNVPGSMAFGVFMNGLLRR